MTPEPAASPTPPPKKRNGGVVVPHHPSWLQQCGSWVITFALRAMALTLRRTWEDRSGFYHQFPAAPAIYVIWHNRLALCMEVYRRYVRPSNRNPGLAALVSASKDGGFLSAILARHGVQAVRGSSSRRGAQALLELTSWAERGYDLAITPDGPRGPRYKVQEGVISLAQVTGRPIIPVSYSLSQRIQLKSWDGFLVPLPFSRWRLIFAPPLRVPRDASDAERERLRAELEATLKSITLD